MRVAAGFTALALASCGGPSLTDEQRDEVADVADAVASDAINDSDRVRELTGQIEELNDKVSDLESELDVVDQRSNEARDALGL